MKFSKKIIAVLLALVLVFSFAACTASEDGGDKAASGVDVKIGVIEIGDDTETYTKAHSDGIRAAAEKLGIPSENIIWKEKVPDTDECYTAATELVASGCNLVISNSYGHQDYMVQAAEENPDVTFVAMTGDYAAISGLDNFYNAFTKIFQARYVSGVVAGMKLKELQDNDQLSDSNFDENGNIKIGYVGAFPYAEVVSGYTAFYLGIKSVVENIVMDVQYTNSWFDLEGEAAAAETLLARGCVIIGQHADSTGAPTAVQDAYNNGTVAYSVGYNIDMTDVAPDVALTSSTNNWQVYYEELFSNFMNGTAITQDWAKGFEADAVGITQLGSACAAGTQEAVDKAIADIKAGTLQVFDTSTFTVDGETVAAAPVDLTYYEYTTGAPTAVYQGETKEAIVTDSANNITYFDESVLRAAPYFTLRIDGITELNANG